jgi:hypothetical protein
MALDWTIWGPIAGKLVTSGDRVTNSTLIDQNYRVRVNLEILNLTKWEFSEPILEVHGGVVSVPPTNIYPLVKEIMVSLIIFLYIKKNFLLLFLLKARSQNWRYSYWIVWYCVMVG